MGSHGHRPVNTMDPSRGTRPPTQLVPDLDNINKIGLEATRPVAGRAEVFGDGKGIFRGCHKKCRAKDGMEDDEM
ncbi:Uncharacterized protein TCM_014678 [Theobroma cacao]|uniref:Uncharacterized protein n=1 Tax=Theobroma cacao TaxID=3641 RepID=A0A061FZ42_THECC|nr:Uncharacterized protein TCM_014678 [Theobroma cacao]